jgi:hypothetical protein
MLLSEMCLFTFFLHDVATGLQSIIIDISETRDDSHVQLLFSDP